MNYEIIGTTASIIVLLSFVIEGERKIRLINLIGSIIFVVYGISINSFSICLLNGILILIHIYYLKKSQ